jgi:hypothetical protein
LIPQHRHHGTTLQKYSESGVFTFQVHSNLRASDTIKIHGILDGGLCYTHPLLLPEHPPCLPPNVTASPAIRHLAAAAVDTTPDAYRNDPINSLDHEFGLHKLSVRADRLL